MTAGAVGTLSRAWMARWDDAQEKGDRMVIRFLRWQSRYQGRLVTLLGGLTAEEQIRSVASPLVVRVQRRANGGANTEADPHLDAIVDHVVRPWERGDGATAIDGTRDAPAMAERGTSTPRGVTPVQASEAGASDNGLDGEAETVSDAKRQGRP